MSHLDAGSIATRFMQYKQRWIRNFCIANFTPSKWWGCDVFEVTKTGYFREYEIKRSVMDFRNDKEKGGYKNWKMDILYETGKEVSKHEMLLGKSINGPSQFYFITPETLGVEGEIPDFAGHIHLIERNNKFYFKEVKSAPRLHSQKIDTQIEKRARAACYYRMHSLRNTIYKMAIDQRQMPTKEAVKIISSENGA